MSGASSSAVPVSQKHQQDMIEQFALDLREARQAAGNPTLTALESQTGVSRSVLSEAFLGRRLPTERTVGCVAEALGENRMAWLERRSRLDPRFTSSRTTGTTANQELRSLGVWGVMAASIVAVGSVLVTASVVATLARASNATGAKR